MSIDDEIRAGLERRASQVPGPPPADLGERAIRGARRARLRRRAAAYGTAVAVATACSLPFVVGGGHPAPARPVAPAPSPAPTATPSHHANRHLPLPTGAPPEVDVIVGRNIVTFASGRPRVLATLPAPAHAATSGVAGDVVSGPGYTVLATPAGRLFSLGVGRNGVAVSDDGTLAAVVRDDHGGQSDYAVVRLRDRQVVARVTAVRGIPIGFAGRSVVVTPDPDAPRGRAFVWDPTTGATAPVPGRYALAVAARHGVAVLGPQPGGQTCFATVRVADWHELARSCRMTMAVLSPDGRRLIGADVDTQGQPDVADVPRLRIDQALVRYADRMRLELDAYTAAWVGGDTALLSGTSIAGEQLVVRCHLSAGRCEIAYDVGPLRDGDEGDRIVPVGRP